MFETTPDVWWWVAAANLTKWLDWEAWSAVASAGAVFTALWVAFLPRREAAARQRETIRTLLYIAATTYGITRDAKRGFDKHRNEHASYLRYMAGAPAIAALGKRVSALPSDQLVGSRWADLLVTVDVFIADWPRRMTVSADDPVETSEADLIASINKLDLWSDSIADLAVARGVTVHPHDDPMVRERLTSARQRASLKPKKD